MDKLHDDIVGRWLKSIKAKDLKSVAADIEGRHISGKSALDCIIAISQSAYENLKLGQLFDSSPEEIVQLSNYFSSQVRSDALINGDKYLRSLYHIINFLLSKGHLMHVSDIFINVLRVKKENKEMYKNYGKSLHQPFVSLAKQSIIKSIERNEKNIKTVLMLFSTLLELFTEDSKVSGVTYLQTLSYISQIVSKKDETYAVQLITSCLELFYEVEHYQDVNCCLPVLLNIYQLFYICQLKNIGYTTALITVSGHLEQVKKKVFDSLYLKKMLVLLCNAAEILLWSSDETFTMKKIQQNNKYLESLKKELKKEETHSTISFIATLIVSCHKSTKQKTLVVPKSCLRLFLEMVLNIYRSLENSPTSLGELVQLLGDVFIYLSDSYHEYKDEILKTCKPVVDQTKQYLLELLYRIKANDEKSNFFIKQALIRFLNLTKVFHMASLTEEVLNITKDVCKFICSLPDDATVDPCLQIQHLTEHNFCLLASALGTKQLDKVLECLVALMIKSPQSSSKAFKLWGDYKHNAVCEDRDEYLDLTIWHIISNKESSMLGFNFQLSDDEIAKLLVRELDSYFINKHLRGKPVIAAVDILLSLKTDPLTQMKGLIIGIDVTTSNKHFPDQCLNYYNASQSLLKQVKKKKKDYNPLEYNCCMGNMLYGQLRFLLKQLRMDCETETVKLSVLPEPLVEDLPEDRPDPNDTCNISTKYSNLSLAKQKQLMENVDSVLKHWGFALANLLEEDNCTYDLTVTLENINALGLLLKLYCDEIRQCRVWNLLYNMATLVKNHNLIVTAVGELMNTPDGLNLEWIEKAEEYIENSLVCWKVKQSYILNSALHKLCKNEIVNGVELLNKLGEEIKKSTVQYTQFLFVLGCFQKLKDWYNYNYKFDVSPSYHFSFHKALSYLLYLADEEKWVTFSEACQIQLQLLQVSKYLGDPHLCLKQPREARCYLKSQLPLAQKLALPLRTVQLLILLAWVDFMTGAADDCAVKLEGLEELLELCSTPIVYGKSISSPTLGSKTALSTPEYIKHVPACNCLPCTTLEYRRIVLETVTLRASFCAAYGQFNDALLCFEVAHRIEDELSKSANTDVLHSCARMWLRYADVLYANERYQEAKAANSKANELLPQHEAITLQYTLRQKSIFNTALQISENGANKIKNDNKNTTPVKAQVLHHFKTPAKIYYPGKSPLAVKNGNVTPVSPFTRPVRRMKLPSSGEENSPTTTSVVKRRTRHQSKVIPETPQTNQRINPSRTPFVVYDEEKKSVKCSKYSKAKSTLKKREILISHDSNDRSKKNLFPSKNSKEDLISDFISKVPTFNYTDDLVTENSKKTHSKTYGRKKTNSSIFKNQNENSKENKSAFEFKKLESVIDSLEDEVQGTPEKETRSVYFTTSLRNKKCIPSSFLCSKTHDSKNRSEEMTKNTNNVCDSDCVEGTPPPGPSKNNSLSLRYKGITRSRNKL